MKKIALALIGLAFIGCTKEEPLAPKKDCNCGFIEDTDMYIKDDVEYYTIKVKNDCSGNSKTFFLEEGYWMNAFAGTNICLTNTGNW
jgi:hypothetical protein